MQERVKIIEFYYVSQRSIVTTQRKYRMHFNVATAPSANMIRSLISRFEERGTVCDLPRPNVHRPVRNVEAVVVVRQSVNDDPSVSTRRRAAQLSMSI